jgi:hypothetical protein
MTQARNPGGATGSKYIVDATQVPTNIAWDAVPSTRNNQLDQMVGYEKDVDASADFIWQFVAEDNGIIRSLNYANGAVAADGSNGWELQFLNKSNSDTVLGYFGIGSGTEAAKATDVDVSVLASASAQIDCTSELRFDKGDVIKCIADRDGTTILGTFMLTVSYESEGR